IVLGCFFFFFQAEDGIRDGHVTGVQTCALPISFYAAMKEWGKYTLVFSPAEADLVLEIRFKAPFNGDKHVPSYAPQCNLTIYDRSEERRVGKECRSRGWRVH